MLDVSVFQEAPEDAERLEHAFWMKKLMVLGVQGNLVD